VSKVYRTCSSCGCGFRTPGGPGRPPTRCDSCRAGIRSDDAAWRKVKARVLLEEPVCAVRGCVRMSTTVDHIIPLSRGGSRLDRTNLQGMCGPHNFAKGAKMPSSTVKAYVCRDCGDPACIGRWHL
jgi:hypothetical protein